MSRRFSFYRKKRGDRVTGSQRLGRLGEGLFYAAFLLLGAGALAALVVRGVAGWSWVIMLLPGAFMLLGLVGLGYTLFQSGTSRERRAAFAKRAADIDLFEPAGSEAPKFPTVPRDADLRNSPGTALAYRLPIGTTPSWQLFAAAMTCLFWNALVGILVVIAVRAHLSGSPDWFLTIFCLPFVGAGLWLCYYVFRQFLVTTGVGPTRIEISEHPLLPGGEYELLLSQAGNLSINVLEVLLVCDEQATYRQGTDTVTDVQRVCRQPILRNENLQIQPGLPYETRCRFRVPMGAMHTFKSAFNAINWKLVVQGDVARWPDYQRDFPVIVYPKVGDPLSLADEALPAAGQREAAPLGEGAK